MRIKVDGVEGLSWSCERKKILDQKRLFVEKLAHVANAGLNELTQRSESTF